MTSSTRPGYTVRKAGPYWAGGYTAMASPCQVLIECKGERLAGKLSSLAHNETVRIESKFSRYRDDNIVHAVNHSGGAPVSVDEETSRLFEFAGQCYQLSGGRFDITSGILRHAWTFSGGVVKPDETLIESLRKRVGWDRVDFDGDMVRLPPGVEIDLGGIGKEYAADRIAALVMEAGATAVLVNLGGDIRAMGKRKGGRPWTIGIQKPDRENSAVGEIKIGGGGVATSGDSTRFCIVEGERLGHILDPRTGRPVAGAPRSATVIADTCTAAGFLATMAMLNGPNAEAFLDAQEVVYHCIR